MSGSQHTLRVTLPAAPAAVRRTEATSDEVLAAAIERKVEAAQERGFAAGLVDTRTSGRDLFDQAIDRLDGARQAATEQLATQAVELALGIARELLRTELSAQNYDLVGIVREALSTADAGREAVTVHVCEADAKLLEDAPLRQGTQVVIDPHLRAGDVHVETSRGVLVREIDDTLETLRERLLEELA